MRTGIKIISQFVAAVSCIAIANTVCQAADKVVLRVGYTVIRDSHVGAGVDALAEALRKFDGGSLEVQHLDGGKAGGEVEMIRKVREGTLEMAFVSSAPVAQLVPEVRVLDLPYVFYNYSHARKALDGPLGKELLDALPRYGLRGLGWAENGFRHITNNKRPIVYPDDLLGLKIRTMASSVHADTMRMLKADPIPLEFPKLFEALRSGEMDAQENPLPVILASKFANVQRYLSLTQHFYSATVVLIAPKVWDKLSADQQKALQSAVLAAIKANRARVNRDEFESLTKLRDAGMQVNTYVDVQAFRRLLRPLYPKILPDLNAKLLEQIRAL